MVNEEKLLRQLQKKKRNSINKAIEIYTPYLTTVIFNLAGTRLSTEDIEEIISDSFITLWNKSEYIDLEKGSIKSYIAKTAKNLALKKLNKQINYSNIDDIDIACETNIDENISSELLWSAVMNLGEPDNEIFIRYYKFNEKLKDISKSMDLNLSTIKSKLSRGKIKLKDHILNAEVI